MPLVGIIRSASSLSRERLLESALAVLECHLQVLLFLVQVCHIGLHCFLLSFKTLLHIGNRCADEPVSISNKFLDLKVGSFCIQ